MTLEASPRMVVHMAMAASVLMEGHLLDMRRPVLSAVAHLQQVLVSRLAVLVTARPHLHLVDLLPVPALLLHPRASHLRARHSPPRVLHTHQPRPLSDTRAFLQHHHHILQRRQTSLLLRLITVLLPQSGGAQARNTVRLRLRTHRHHRNTVRQVLSSEVAVASKHRLPVRSIGKKGFCKVTRHHTNCSTVRPARRRHTRPLRHNIRRILPLVHIQHRRRSGLQQ